MLKMIKILVLLIIIIALYLFYEDNFLQISRYKISNEKLSEDFKGYKIIQISDFHNVKSKIINTQLVKSIKKEKPNIIVITGDFIDAHKTDIDISINLIKQIIDVAPIYYVTGNHEASIKKYKYLKEKLQEIGVNILENKAMKIKEGNSTIELLGINDPSFEKSNKNRLNIIEDYLNQLNYDKNNFSILLSHRPEVFDIYVEQQFNLVFTGHAHGGQIRIPFIGGLFAPNQGILPKYTSGTYTEKETTMLVSRGIGNSTFPFRINNRPELVIVTLN